jgi:mRNA-degrading endonuclease RelE of RelBE toxin-antitoxin system
VLDGIERRLGVAPTRVSRSAVKRLRQPAPAEYRLRVGEFRVFYVVRGETVMVRRILSKRDSLKYLGEAS